MASTSAFGWETPDDTDLVKDGAAAIRTLGNSIDTSMADLKGGTSGQVLSKASNTDMDFTWVAQDDSNAIQNAIVDAKGDLIAATAADTPARLAVGTNGQVLTADSTAATGLAWATAATGGMTLLNAGGTTLSGASVTISSIPSTYTRLEIVVIGSYTASADQYTQFRFNGDSGSNYVWCNVIQNGTSFAGGGNLAQPEIVASFRSITTNTTQKTGFTQMTIYNYADTTPNKYMTGFAYSCDSGNVIRSGITNALYSGTSAISSVTVFSGVNWSGGTVYIYGVK